MKTDFDDIATALMMFTYGIATVSAAVAFLVAAI